MSYDNKTEKALVISNISSVLKKLKRIKHQVVLFDMRDHARAIDKNMADLIRLKRDLGRNDE